ncbi:thiosulfate oxidation carrier protein SoxY [Blastochloris viridis]|nr:thiosulfate oxidation carrier protein SoxY [Blastochloris viridis]
MLRSVDRRAVLRGGGGLVVLAMVSPAAASPPDDVAAAIRDLVGDAVLHDGCIRLQVPATAENGAVVPVTVAVESPMTADAYVRAIHIVATGNPTPGVASYRFTPASGRAEVSARMRLAQKQTVIVLAELSDGTVRRATAEISVSVGGCLT